MKLTITLISMLLLTKIQADCPITCNCTSTLLSCINKNLESVPNFKWIESSPLIIDLSGNKLLFINEEDFNFNKIDEVKEVYLNNSGIADIGDGTFDNMENLQELYLGQNLLLQVPENLIEELDNMVLLDLSNNYFNGNMPLIKSESLEVLALVNAKISNLNKQSLEFLPNLKLLLLQQNNIKYLSFDYFKNYNENSFFMKLSYNSWSCSCDNFEAFTLLADKKFLDTSEPYKCVQNDGKTLGIFDIDFCNNDNHQIDLKNLKVSSSHQEEYINDDLMENTEIDIKSLSDDDLGAILPLEDTLNINETNHNKFFIVILTSASITFMIGFICGLVFYKIFHMFLYKKLQRQTDSRVQLLNA